MQSVAIVTGAAHRIGRCVATTLHAKGYNVVAHFNQSANAAQALVQQLNQLRPHSAIALSADLGKQAQCEQLATAAIDHWGRLDLLVNNASSYLPTPLATLCDSEANGLLESNVKGPAYMAQYCAAALTESSGAIVNITDSNVLRQPIADHPIYTAAKAGLHGLTLALARDLAPKVRVNGIAPGAILWAASEDDPDQQASIVARTALGKIGQPQDIANAVLFMAQANYVTGYVMKVDGGLNIG